MSNGQVLLDDNNKPVTPLYDATGHQVVNWQAGPVSTDATNNQKYAPAAVDVTVNLPANQSVNIAQVNGATTPVASGDGVVSTNIPTMVPLSYNSGGGSYDRNRSIGGLGDGLSFGIPAGAVYLHNGASWDRQRANEDPGALITAVAVTTSQNSGDQTNYNWRGVKVALNMTSVGTGSVTLTIQGKDTVSGSYYTLLSGAAVVTNVLNVYEVYPGVTATANVSASTTVPRTFRVLVTANNANPTTYTVGAMFIL
jgi:hypothetical protein